MDKKYADYKELLLKYAELREQIDALPIGSIGKKTVGVRTYFYHRFYVNGKRKEKYIPAGEVETFRTKIKKRRDLEAEHKKLAREIERIEGKQRSGIMHTPFIDGWGLRMSDRVADYMKSSINGSFHPSDCGVDFAHESAVGYCKNIFTSVAGHSSHYL